MTDRLRNAPWDRSDGFPVQGDIPEKGIFDRFAEKVAVLVSRAPFFAFCVILVVLWAIEGAAKVLIEGHLGAFTDDKYQLQINTTTTIITFWLVSLLQNTAARSDTAVQRKLDAQSRAIRDVMIHLSQPDDDADFDEDIRALEEAVGLESEVGTKKGPR